MGKAIATAVLPPASLEPDEIKTIGSEIGDWESDDFSIRFYLVRDGTSEAIRQLACAMDELLHETDLVGKVDQMVIHARDVKEETKY